MTLSAFYCMLNFFFFACSASFKVYFEGTIREHHEMMRMSLSGTVPPHPCSLRPFNHNGQRPIRRITPPVSYTIKSPTALVPLQQDTLSLHFCLRGLQGRQDGLVKHILEPPLVGRDRTKRKGSISTAISNSGQCNNNVLSLQQRDGRLKTAHAPVSERSTPHI